MFFILDLFISLAFILTFWWVCPPLGLLSLVVYIFLVIQKFLKSDSDSALFVIMSFNTLFLYLNFLFVVVVLLYLLWVIFHYSFGLPLPVVCVESIYYTYLALGIPTGHLYLNFVLPWISEFLPPSYPTLNWCGVGFLNIFLFYAPLLFIFILTGSIFVVFSVLEDSIPVTYARGFKPIEGGVPPFCPSPHLPSAENPPVIGSPLYFQTFSDWLVRTVWPCSTGRLEFPRTVFEDGYLVVRSEDGGFQLPSLVSRLYMVDEWELNNLAPMSESHMRIISQHHPEFSLFCSCFDHAEPHHWRVCTSRVWVCKDTFVLNPIYQEPAIVLVPEQVIRRFLHSFVNGGYSVFPFNDYYNFPHIRFTISTHDTVTS